MFGRTQLKERIRELERQIAGWKEDYSASRERADKAQATIRDLNRKLDALKPPKTWIVFTDNNHGDSYTAHEVEASDGKLYFHRFTENGPETVAVVWKWTSWMLSEESHG